MLIHSIRLSELVTHRVRQCVHGQTPPRACRRSSVRTSASTDHHQQQQQQQQQAGEPVRRGSGPANPVTVGVVTLATEALRVLGVGRDRYEQARALPAPAPSPAPGDVDAVARRVTADFGQAYFVRGVIDDGIYEADCEFVDPTVRFRGLDLWKRNLALLTPFLLAPSVRLLRPVERRGASEEGREQLVAIWALETWLKLPWRPRIAIEGTTVYTLNQDANRVARHVESWDVAAFEALQQMFRPTQGPPSLS